MTHAPHPLVVGLGEALFDVFDAGPRLGGAPLNVVVHTDRLLRPHGGAAQIVSRIGDDELGEKLLKQVADLGIDTATIQRDDEKPTGRVEVERHAGGGHAFHIAKDSAWDRLTFTPEAEALAAKCAAVAFGSLGQRSAASRETIRAFLAAAPDAIKLFDVNLRSSDGRDFYDQDILTTSCDAADIVKLNDEELRTVCDLVGVTSETGADPALAAALAERFGLRAVVLTRGAQGTAAWVGGQWLEGPEVAYEGRDGADTVGAGDACSAGLLSALVLGRDMEKALEVANHMGAFVAGQVGATPALPDRILKLLG